MSRENRQAHPPRKTCERHRHENNKFVIEGLRKALATAEELDKKGFELLSGMAAFRNPVVTVVPCEKAKQEFDWGTRHSRMCAGRTIKIRVANYDGCQIEWRDDQ